MFQMFKQFFVAITVLFGAAEKTAKALDHLATWSEESAGAFADQARIERQQKLKALKAQATVDTKELKDKQLNLAA